MDSIPLYVIDNDGRKVPYRGWKKIPIEQLEEFERCVHEERIKHAVEKGKPLNSVKYLNASLILRNINRDDFRRFELYRRHHLQPGDSRYFDEERDGYSSDMNHLGKFSMDYSTERALDDFIDTLSIKQTLISGGITPDRVDLLIRCEVTRDKRKNEIAVELGIDQQILTMRLQRIKANAKRIIEGM